MSPHHLFWHRHHGFYNPMFWGPSRFLWFSFGSLATFAWMHYRRRDANQIGYDDGRRGCGRFHGHWEREAGPQGRTARFDEQQQQQQQQQQWGSRRGAEVPPDDDSRFDANGGRRESSPPPPVAAEGSAGRLPVDRELDRLREMSRNAEETISGMSEATIDSMMGALQRLKDRLVERHGQQSQDSQKPSATTTPLATPPEEPPRPHHWV